MHFKEIVVNIDGASRGNPGPAAIAGVLWGEDGTEIERFSEFLGEATNNEAEYRALLEALRRTAQYHPRRVVVRSDSELLVKQMRGEYAVRSASLAPLAAEARALAARIPDITFTHVRREENALADSLCNRALDLALRQPTRVAGTMSVTVREKFDCAHRLTEYEGACARLHGHTYVVEVTVSGAQLAENGLLIDFQELKGALRDVLASVDHAYLNEVPPFDSVSPTGENIAVWVSGEVSRRLPPSVRVSSVTVYESENAWVTYEP